MIGHAIKLRWLEYFAAVAEELHFGRAAERMHVSTPALSHQIRDLEAALGVALFERTTRTVRLTADGRRLYARVRPALDLIAAGVDELTELGAGTGGVETTITIGFVSALAGSVMPAAVQRFRQVYPRTRLRLEQVGSRVQLERLAAGTLDAGLYWTIGESAPPRPLHQRDVGAGPLHVALPADHPLAPFPELHLADLAHEEWLMTSDGTDTESRTAFVALCQRNGFTPTIRNEATWISALQALVAAGSGICAAPSATVHPPAAGVVLLPLVDCRLRLVAVQPSRRTVRADRFVDQVIDVMGSLAA